MISPYIPWALNPVQGLVWQWLRQRDRLALKKKDILSLLISQCHLKRGPFVWDWIILETWKQGILTIQSLRTPLCHSVWVGNNHEMWLQRGGESDMDLLRILSSRKLSHWRAWWSVVYGKEPSLSTDDHCGNGAPSLWPLNCSPSRAVSQLHEVCCWERLKILSPSPRDHSISPAFSSHRVVKCWAGTKSTESTRHIAWFPHFSYPLQNTMLCFLTPLSHTFREHT
jgi:hypothetical protein